MPSKGVGEGLVVREEGKPATIQHVPDARVPFQKQKGRPHTLLGVYHESVVLYSLQDLSHVDNMLLVVLL